MDFFRTELEVLRERNLYRQLKWFHGTQSARVTVDGRPCILLASNNYLGLTEHPAVKEAAVQAVLDWGTGAGGSRLISGNYRLYQELERKIADFKKAEEAVVFSSGYLANLGTINALAGKGDVILSDELNHASIIDGCRLSRADVLIYRHKDPGHLEKLLREAQNYRHRLIVTDGVFSMDGDLAPLPEIVALAEKYRAYLMVDDAHATGVFGRRGAGTAEHFGLEGRVDVQMGTLSKALASAGGYVAGKKHLIDYLRNRARKFIFTTGLPPAAVGAALEALDVLQDEAVI
ncbi:MAG: aminotransferase class I/II-fold pyridoxal phosphate-dependent enzyme, partial [Desulfotomaculales bacterium]